MGTGVEASACDIDRSSVKLHFFGHAHTNGMGKDDNEWELHGVKFPGRCFVNASMVTSLYLPTRLPIVVDIPMECVQGSAESRPWSDSFGLTVPQLARMEVSTPRGGSARYI